MIDRIVTSNLKRAQSFDLSLRAGVETERIVRREAAILLNEGNAAERARIIGNIVRQLKDHAGDTVLPTARKNGVTAANDILAKTPRPKQPGDTLRRQVASNELDARTRERAEIVSEQIDSLGSTLKSRLSKFWREPGEARAGKAFRLIETFTAQEKRRKAYEAQLRDFYAGVTKTRPSKPALDFLSEFILAVKSEIRSQARRIGTDAELMTFRRTGYEFFIWITPNGHSACPDCQKRQGAVLTLEEWETLGRPGSGMTVCGDNCFCTLLPVETMEVSPSLAKRAPEGSAMGRGVGPMTTAAQAEIFNRNRYHA